MTQRLGDIAREAVALFKYNGHRSQREAEFAACAASIVKAKADLHSVVMESARRELEYARVTPISGSCVHDTSDRAQHQLMEISCSQCLAFMRWLKTEGFEASLGEDKHSYYINISWKESK